MPRTARIKSNESIYHIMTRSVGDINLFRDDQDKYKYLELLKKYQLKFNYKVYAYCLMDNHSHILIDSNGADISKFMHGVNQSYAQYFNRKYNRKGHVFGDRFKSIIVTDDRYLLTLSAYIHNNPRDLKKYNKNPEKYEFSSLNIYLGLSQDKYELLDYQFILNLFDKILNKSREGYLNFVFRNDDLSIKNNIEFNDEKTQYRSERIILAREYTPNKVIEFVSKYVNIDSREITIKYNRKTTEGKAIVVVLMSRYCNYTIKQICEEIGNITQSRVSSLCRKGLDYILNEKKYENIFNDFICKNVS